MKYLEIKTAIEEGEAVIVLDKDDFFDWGIVHILPQGIELASNLALSQEGERACFYRYQDLAMVAQDGIVIESVEEGDLRGKAKAKVFQISLIENAIKLPPQDFGSFSRRTIDPAETRALPTKEDVDGLKLRMRALRDSLDQLKIRFNDHGHPHTHPPHSHEFGNRIMFGDPVMIENIWVYPLPTSLYIVQKGGAKAVINWDVDFYET